MENQVIYIVEDDYFQADFLTDVLRKGFPMIAINHIATHSAFIDQLPEIAQDQTVCIILDEMLRWKDDETAVNDPPDLDSFLTAGIDCLKRLRSRGSDIPVLIYTVLDRSDVPLADQALLSFLRKDAPDTQVVDWVRRAVKQRARGPAASR